MKKLFSLFCLSFTLLGCSCKCRYNEYLPENNPLIIPESLKPHLKQTELETKDNKVKHSKTNL